MPGDLDRKSMLSHVAERMSKAKRGVKKHLRKMTTFDNGAPMTITDVMEHQLASANNDTKKLFALLRDSNLHTWTGHDIDDLLHSEADFAFTDSVGTSLLHVTAGKKRNFLPF